MKSNKLILRFFALCMAFSTAIALTSCNFNKTDSESTGSESTGSESTGSEQNEDESIYQVTKEVWEAAFSDTAFANFTAEVSEVSKNGNETVQSGGTIKVAVPNAQITVVEDEQTSVFYYSQTETVLYHYFDAMGTGEFNKMPVPDATLTDTIDLENKVFGENYATFTYNAESNAYEADRIQPDAEDDTYVLSDLQIKFENGKLISFLLTSSHVVEGETYVSTTSMTFSNFGTTTVTLPIINGPSDVAGDGLISENEWKKSLSPDAFKDVTLVIQIASQGETQSVQTIQHDQENPNVIYTHLIANGVDEDNVPYTIETSQYYEKADDNFFAYVFSLGDYMKMTVNADAWASATALPDAISEHIPLYGMFLFDGLTAVYSSEGNSSVLVFNEQEQLVSLTITDTLGNGRSFSYTFSNYGSTSVTLPQNYIDYTTM